MQRKYLMVLRFKPIRFFFKGKDFDFQKEPARFERKVINIYFTLFLPFFLHNLF